MINSLVFALLVLAQDPPASNPESTSRAKSVPKAESPASQVDPSQGGKSEGQKDRRGRRGRSTRPEANRWWDGLSEQERVEARRKFKRYRDLPPEPKAELDRRHELIKRETAAMMKEMPEVEREALMGLKPEVRNKSIQGLLQRRLKERLPNEAEHPGRPPQGEFRGQSFEERLRDSKKAIDETRFRRLGKEIEWAVDEGWIGQRAAEFYRELPPEAIHAELMRIRQWRLIDRFNRDHAWPELGVDAEGKEKLLAMPPGEFFHFLNNHGPAKEFRRRNPKSNDRRGGGSRTDRRDPRPGERKAERPGKGDGPKERPPRDGKRREREKKLKNENGY